MQQRIGKVLVIHCDIPSLLREYLDREHLCKKPYVPDKVPTANRAVYGHRHFIELQARRVVLAARSYLCLPATKTAPKYSQAERQPNIPFNSSPNRIRKRTDSQYQISMQGNRRNIIFEVFLLF